MFEALDQAPSEGISPIEFEKLVEKTITIQEYGRTLVRYYLEKMNIKYRSKENEAEGYDFFIENDEFQSYICVKSTMGEFKDRLHFSLDELLRVQESDNYLVYRAFDVTENSAKIRIANDLRSFSENIMLTLEKLPAGVHSNSISVRPEILNFGEPILVQIPEDEE